MNSAPTHLPGRRAVAAAIVAASALALAIPVAPAAACGAAAGTVQATAVDEGGEVALADGRRLRIAGLDLPVPSRGDPAVAAAAARALLAKLFIGSDAALTVVSAAPDRWDRTLGDLVAPVSEGASDSAAEALLAAGLARVRPKFETRGCEAVRLALESAARAKGLGVWRDPDYVVLAADDRAALARRDGRFVIVEGAVRRIGVGRARLYLDLGGRGALSVRRLAQDAGGVPGGRRSVERPRRRENSGARRIGQPIWPATGDRRPAYAGAARAGRSEVGKRTGRMRVWAGDRDMRRSGRGSTFRLRALAAIAAALALVVAGCASIDPPAHPTAASLVPTAAPLTTGGAETSPERKRLVDAFGGEYSAPAVERYLNDILTRLAQASDTPSEPYRVTILDSPVVNAFALPNGEIFITRGLLTLANDSSEVAAVMAHEIAHVTARHAAQRAELEKTAQLFTRVSDQVLDRPQEGEAVQARMQLSIARFSRQQEFEADQIGIGVIAKAGFDPYAASRFLTSLGRWSALRTAMIGAGSANKPDMMATHPSTPERVAQAVVEAHKFGAPGVGETGRDEYLAVVDGIAYGDNPAQGLVRGVRFLHPKLGFAFQAPDGFTLENQSAALIGVGEGGAQALRLDSIALSPSTSLEDELASGWIDGVKTSSIEALPGGDYPMAIAAAQGDQWSFRLGAVRVGDRVFRLIFAAHSLTPAVDARFRAAIRSFHRLLPGEAAEAQALRLRTVEARAGDTAESMAQRMSPEERAVGQFLVLNGLDREGPLVPGQRYKIIAP